MPELALTVFVTAIVPTVASIAQTLLKLRNAKRKQVELEIRVGAERAVISGRDPRGLARALDELTDELPMVGPRLPDEIGPPPPPLPPPRPPHYPPLSTTPPVPRKRGEVVS